MHPDFVPDTNGDMPKRTTLPNPRVQPRFGGVCTFARFPMLELVQQDYLPVDWAVYGFPFDAGVTYRPGTRFGPRAIRDASQYVKPYHIEHDIDVTEWLSLADAGDAPIKPFSCKGTLDSACEHACGIADPSHTKILALGGDHSLAYANLKATWIRRGKPSDGLAMIHFDSHVDTVDMTGGEKWSHASPFIRLIEEGCLDPKRMISIGVKGPLNTRHDLDYAKDVGIEMITYSQWRREGDVRLREFLKRLGNDETYVTFDVDALDPAFAPGTGTPCMGGFTSAEALELVRSLAGVNVVGGDVVEVLPAMDHAEITALIAAHLAFEILALSAVHKRQMHS